MERNNLPKIDIDETLSVGKVISTEEAMKEITPVSWSENVLNGDYVGKVIVSESNTTTEKKLVKKIN